LRQAGPPPKNRETGRSSRSSTRNKTKKAHYINLTHASANHMNMSGVYVHIRAPAIPGPASRATPPPPPPPSPLRLRQLAAPFPQTTPLSSDGTGPMRDLLVQWFLLFALPSRPAEANM
jgi:hypothetical protein